MNLFDYSIPKEGEIFTSLFEHKNIIINRIVSSDTLKPEKYLQEEDEWLVLLEGEALLLVEQKEVSLFKGDTLFIPSHTKHQVLRTVHGTVWLTVHID